jgi:hypothetical protein
MKTIGCVIATLPSVGVVSLFYALAVHMYRTLGAWPTCIGTGGFPPALRMHSEAAVIAFGILVQSLFLLPMPLLVCLFVLRWRHFAPYLAVYGSSVVFSFVLMLFAPPPFLTWWWD